MRRLRYALTRPIDSRWSYRIQCIYKTRNASSTDDHIYLQDSYFRLSIGRHDLTMGNQKIPFGRERLQSDKAIPFPDRAILSDRLHPLGQVPMAFARAVGLCVTSPLSRYDHFEAGIFNGNGAWQSPNRRAGLIEAVRWTHALPLPHKNDRRITMGIAGALCPVDYSSHHYTETFIGGEILAHYGRIEVETEAMFSRFHNISKDKLERDKGIYVQGRYRLRPQWSLAVRQENIMQSLLNSRTTHTERNTWGVQWQQGRQQFQVAYVTGYGPLQGTRSIGVLQWQYALR